MWYAMRRWLPKFSSGNEEKCLCDVCVEVTLLETHQCKRFYLLMTHPNGWSTFILGREGIGYALRRWLPKFPSGNEEKTVTTEPYTQENDRRGDRCAGVGVGIEFGTLVSGVHDKDAPGFTNVSKLGNLRKSDFSNRDPGSSNISEPFLLVADKDGEILLQVNITSGSTTTLPLGDVGVPVALDYDPLTDYVYWSDNRNKKIHRARRDGSGRETILDISNVRGLALDHAGGDIYWTDYNEDTISVANMDGSSTGTLLTSSAVSRPWGLVLDPRNGLMYWVDWGNDRIARAVMDGSNPTTIITGVSAPRAVTIDYREDRLYYSDVDRMYSSDLLGNDIQQLLYESGKDVRGIAVDENYVYWSSYWLSKTDLTKTVLVEGLEWPYGICLSTAAPPGVTTGK
ncbi:hypothetical protein Bbelb_376960 [Branchiostoma belcheri]|nr:hypothetical protein Bbelb_376960 [Branchiostoma belcheri]